MAITISLSNIKGGCGKTTSVVCISKLLAVSGYKVLVVDLDPQRNTSFMFGIMQEDEIKYETLFCEKIVNKVEMDVLVYKTESENIDIIPATKNLKDVIYTIHNFKGSSMPTVELFFRHNLSLIKDRYDYIIFDTSPFCSTLTYCTLAATDNVLVPVQADNFSYEGILDLIDIAAELNKKYSLSIEFKGIFFTCANPKTILYRQLKESYEQLFGKLFMPDYIRANEKVRQSNTCFVDLLEHDKKNSVNLDYIGLLTELGYMDAKHYNNILSYIQGGKK